jgi:hypothetical protein
LDLSPFDLQKLSQAKVQRYKNRTDKRARYRPTNPDKKSLGDPVVRQINAKQRVRLKEYDPRLAA